MGKTFDNTLIIILYFNKWPNGQTDKSAAVSNRQEYLFPNKRLLKLSLIKVTTSEQLQS